MVWWDPHVLALDPDLTIGLRRDDLIAKDGDPGEASRHGWRRISSWQAERDEAVARRTRAVGTRPHRDVDRGDRAVDRLAVDGPPVTPEIEVIDFSRSTERPFGPRFGSARARDARDGAARRRANTVDRRGCGRRRARIHPDGRQGTLRRTRKSTRPSRS